MSSVDSSLLALPAAGQLSEIFGSFNEDDAEENVQFQRKVDHRLGAEKLRLISADNFLLLVIAILPADTICAISCAARCYFHLAYSEASWRAAHLRSQPNGSEVEYDRSWKVTVLKALGVRTAPADFRNTPRNKRARIRKLLLGEHCEAKTNLELFPCQLQTSLTSLTHVGVSAVTQILGTIGASISLASSYIRPWRDVSASEFTRVFDACGRPFLGKDAIRGCGQVEGHFFHVRDWPERWSAEEIPSLLAGPSGAADALETLFGIIAPFGKTVRMSFRSYLAYAKHNADSGDPLYLFDSGDNASALMKLVSLPRHVEDFFDGIAASAVATSAASLDTESVAEAVVVGTDPLVGLERQYLTVGPLGSGARFHVDPFAASAVSLLLRGRKAWAMFPPGPRPPPGVRATYCGRHVVHESPPALWWWRNVFLENCRVGAGVAATTSSCDSAAGAEHRWGEIMGRAGALIFVQEAGDMVYTPSGWWHTTLNLDDDLSVALTKHVCTTSNAAAVAAELRCHGWDEVAQCVAR